MLTRYLNNKDWEQEFSTRDAEAAASNSCLVNSLVEDWNFVFDKASDSITFVEKWSLIASMVLSMKFDLEM